MMRINVSACARQPSPSPISQMQPIARRMSSG